MARVLLKAALLFAALNVAFALADPLPALGRLSLYNHALPGRSRLPYGANPARDYNLSPLTLEALLAAHEIDGAARADDELRVLLIGDSSVWGFLLPADQTVAAALNQLGLVAADGRRVRAFNLGYPIMSLAKDLVLLERGLAYQPHLVVWLVTLESFPLDKQLYPPLLQHNAPAVRALIARHDLALDPADPRLIDRTWAERTLLGRRRDLADLLRLQLYGVLWAASGIDQALPDSYTPRMEDLPPDPSFQGFGPGEMQPADLAFDLLDAGVREAGPVPVLIVNEPMFVSRGANSDLRYNFFYPRWAYDQYREALAARCGSQGWRCLDLWDALPAETFTDSAVHYDAQGARLLAARLGDAILVLAAELSGEVVQR